MKRPEYIAVFVLIICACAEGLAQQPALNHARVEALSLEYYTKEQWDQLQRLGSKAIRSGIDYYALRYRMGAAAFQQRQYWKSIRHFERALDFNSADPYAQEYLFFSYWYDGRFGDAWLASRHFGTSFFENNGLSRTRWLEYATLEAGLKASNIIEIKSLVYTTFGLGHRPGLRWSYYQTLSLLSQQFLNDRVSQTDYSGQLRFQAARGLGIYLTGKYLYAQIQSTTSLRQGAFRYLDQEYLLQQGWALQGGLEWTVGRWTLYPYGARTRTPVHFEGTYTTYQENAPHDITEIYEITSDRLLHTWQGGMELNVRIMPAIQLGVQPNVLIEGDSTWSFYSAQIQWTPSNRLAFSLEYLDAPRRDFLEAQGLILNNDRSNLWQRWRAQATWQVARKVHGYGLYQWEDRMYQGHSFQYHTFITGIKFIL